MVLGIDLFQILHAVSRKFYCSMKFRRVSCDQIAEISVKLSLVRPEGIPRSIDGNQNPLEIGTALEDQLMIGDLDIAVRTIAQSIAVSANLDEAADVVRQLIFFWCIKAGAKSIIIVRSLDTRFAPFASVIDTGDSRHSEEQSVGKRQMCRIGQNTGNPGDIMVVHKIHQMLSAVNTPVLRNRTDGSENERFQKDS